MSRIAQKQDLSDPDVIRRLCQRVGNERYLTALYLLTVADIRGTSPKVWNAWKGKLLEDLYRYTLRTLGGRAPDASAEVEARKREALVQLALHALPFEGAQGAVGHAGRGLLHAPRRGRHRLAHPPPLAPRGRTPTPSCAPASRPWAKACRCWSTRPTRPDLFARICGYFDQAGFSILDAKVHTTHNGLRWTPSRWWPPCCPSTTANWHMVESDLAHTRHRNRPARCPSRPRAGVAPRQELSLCTAGDLARRKSPALAAEHFGQRPRRPAVQRGARAGPPPSSTCNWPRSPRWASGWKTPS
jgi:[protein-PII] uridylyltransferase